MGIMDIILTLIQVLGGALAGFLTSLFFWLKDRRRDIPRLAIEAKSSEPYASAQFLLRNTGTTHAEHIEIEDKDGGTIKTIRELKPDGVEEFDVLAQDESETLLIKYRDVWNNTYISKWEITGPSLLTAIDTKGESIEFFEPYEIERLD